MSLAVLRTDPSLAIGAGLCSDICHQGTVYKATAYAVPFIEAVAASDVSEGIRTELLALSGNISIGGSSIAPHGELPRGSHSRLSPDEFAAGVRVLAQLSTD